MSKKLEFNFDTEIKLSKYKQDEYIIKGIALEFDKVNHNKFNIKGARVEEDLDKVPLLKEHISNQRVGNVTFKIEKDRVAFEARVNPDTELGKESWAELKHGDITGVSIGGYIDTSKGYDFDESGVIQIEQIVLYELSLVAVPADSKARIEYLASMESEKITEDLNTKNDKDDKKIQDIKKSDIIEKEIEKERLSMKNKKDVKDMSLVELISLKKEKNDEISKISDVVLSFDKQIEENEGDDKLEGLVKENSENKEVLQSLSTEIEDLETRISFKREAVQKLKESNKIEQTKKIMKEGKKMETNKELKLTKEVFQDRPEVALAYKKAVVEAMKSKTDVKQAIGEAIKGVAVELGFTGDIANLSPTTISKEIQETLEKFESVLPLVKRVTGTDKYAFFINTSEELGYGWDSSATDKTKKEQSNVLKEVSINIDFIYKYIKVPRKMIDAPGSVLYNYVLTELAQRLIMTLERAIVVGDGLAAGAEGKIEKVIPMVSHDNDEFATTLTAEELTGDTLSLQDEELNENGQMTVHVMNKKTFGALKRLVNTSGNKIYETGTTTIDGKIYDTLDGDIIVKAGYLAPFKDAADTDNVIVSFKVNGYTLVSMGDFGEIMEGFKMESNQYEFLAEFQAGGDIEKPKSVTILKKSVTAPARSTKKSDK